MCVPSRVKRGVSTRCMTESTGVTSCGERGHECAAIGERQGGMKPNCDPSRGRGGGGEKPPGQPRGEKGGTHFREGNGPAGRAGKYPPGGGGGKNRGKDD